MQMLLKTTTNVCSNCSDFLENDITMRINYAGSLVNRFWRNIVQIDCGHSLFWREAPKADRMMRTQTNWYKHTCAYCTHTRAHMRYACVWYPWANLGLGYSRQIFTSIFRRSLILVLACSRIDSCVLSHELCNLKATSLGIILGIELKKIIIMIDY